MIDVVFIPFLFIAISGLTVALFGGWLFVVCFKGMAWMLGSLFAQPQTLWRQPISTSHSCGGCGQGNPATARFCRRCGKPING